jgi:hypothetical protein
MAGNATVIDELVVELGLDPTKFTKGQKEALESLKKFGDANEKRSKEQTGLHQKESEALAGLRTQALGAISAFASGGSLALFAANAISSGAALGRLTRNIGINAETISKWQDVARIFGGDAATMESSFVTLSDAFTGWKVGRVSPLIEDLRNIGAAGGKVIDINKGVEQSLFDLADNFKAIHDRGPDGPALAGFLSRQAGIDPGLFDILVQGADRVREALGKVKGATQENVDEAGKLDRQWNALLVTFERFGKNTILNIANSDDSMFNPFKNGSDAKDLKMIGGWIDYLFPGKAKAATGGGASSTGSGAFGSQAEKEAFIRAEASKRGLDPDIMMAVVKSEGFNKYVGDRGTSFGDFQLHYKNNIPGLSNSGLGDAFTKATGKDARDPSTWQDQTRFALDRIKAGGLAPWHGWKGSPFAGGAGGGPTSTTNITGPITINAAPGADGKQLAADFSAELRRQSMSYLANGGSQ